jgi:serine/threonine protein kinase/Tol biopolymer transport system component
MVQGESGMILQPGTVLNNRYRIISVLGQGGMGAVYRAVDERLGSPVAVKENLNLADEFARQFKREAVTLASLRHPALPRVADYFAFPKQGQYLVMDYIEGEDLRQRIERAERLPDRDVVLIGEAVCNALNYLHTRVPPVIHRDIKPGNIKISPTQQVFLVDFGLVKQDFGDQATTTGARAMTPGYSPPEQYGTARTDARTDIYSLAATLYAALTGSIPEDSITRATRNVSLTPISSLAPGTNKRLSAVIEKGLELNQDDRYQNAIEFRDALLASLELTGSFQQPPQISAPPPEFIDSLPVDTNIEEIYSPAEELPKPVIKEDSLIVFPPVKKEYPRTKARVLFLSAIILAVLVLGSFFIPWQNLPSFVTTSAPTVPEKSPVAAFKKTNTSVVQIVKTAIPTSTAVVNIIIPPPEPTETTEATEEIPTETVVSIEITPSVTPAEMLGGSSQIAFSSERTGNFQIWLMNIDGTNQHQITGLANGACQPAWSPDGSQLAFISPCNGKKDIYTGSKIYLTDNDGKKIWALPIPLNSAGDFSPKWSPDGKMLAFASLRGDSKPHIFLYTFSDSSVRQITSAAYGDISPAWAPSGLQIAFARQFPNAQIWITDLTGKQQFQYSPSGAIINNWPEWNKDGSVLFYSQMSPDAVVPYLIGLSYENRNKNLEIRIPPIGAEEIGPIVQPSVSPDGKWFTFEGWPDGINLSIDGSNRKRLTTDKDHDFGPVWRPAGISTS